MTIPEMPTFEEAKEILKGRRFLERKKKWFCAVSADENLTLPELKDKISEAELIIPENAPTDFSCSEEGFDIKFLREETDEEYEKRIILTALRLKFNQERAKIERELYTQYTRSIV